ncbi:hypothetical protein [Mesorhizobium sp. 113-1-2]|uniref:hypothetical protein n=1 Tax=Mesorhizobium sp. 113-1-2 TaxID=2744515 RepID=UPI001FD1081D|nr:hypothetical protein [Mesorhizobium sp. 113-1-2]
MTIADRPTVSIRSGMAKAERMRCLPAEPIPIPLKNHISISLRPFSEKSGRMSTRRFDQFQSI